MKRILVVISPIIFLLFTACGGDDSAPPPKAACSSEESLKNLQCVSQIAQQICCGQYSQTANSYQQYCAAITNPAVSSGGYNMPPPPPPPPTTAQLPPQILGCSPSTQPLTCDEAITNFELQYKSTYATCQTSESQAWHDQQGKAVITCVGGSMGISTPEQFNQSPTAQCQASMTYATASPTVTGSVPPGTQVPPPLDGSGNAANTPPPTAPPPTAPPPTNTGVTEPPPPIGGQGMTSNQVVRLDQNSIPGDF